MAGYVELHCHSGFSFLDGASSPQELATEAISQGYEALALTDHDGVWGAMEFAQAAVPLGLKPIVGAEVTITSFELATKSRKQRLRPAGTGNGPLPAGSGREAEHSGGVSHLTLLAESAAGWRNLCLLLTEAHAGTRPVPGREPLPPTLSLDALADKSEGLICLSGCARDGVLARIHERAGGRPSGPETQRALTIGRRLRAIFGPEGLRIELGRPFWRHDKARNRWLAGLAERLGVPVVATGNVHAHTPQRALLQDALVAIRARRPLDESDPARRRNLASVLAPPEAMLARFAEYPQAAAESVRLAERVAFDLTSDHGYRYPGAEDERGDRDLAALCASRFEERYRGTPERAEARRQLEEELRVIRKLGLSGFFLLHADLLELAREVAVEVRGFWSARSVLPPGRGRGSSVSSIVCYLTGLSHVDPVKAGLYLGRFLNEEITEMPDIDIDFPRDVRERLIPRIHKRYGAERSGLVAAFPTFRVRGAIRDLGKALGLPQAEIARVAGAVDSWTGEGFQEDLCMAIGAGRARTPRWQALGRLLQEARGLPRHASQHSGGMVLSTRPLTELCPVVPASMEGRQIVQWDKDSCADAGFLKIDLLGLGMLSAVERAVESVARTRGERLDLSRIPLDDPKVYRAIQAAETTGVFQIESRAQMQMLPRSLPENLDDLTVQVALVRPGPIQGGAVHPYLERRRLLREDPTYAIPYEHPSLEPCLADTLGAIVFQDQVIQVAMALAGFSAGEAEGLRRAMSRKRSSAAINAYRERFIDGAVGLAVDQGVAERVFEQIRGFSGFGFPKSHAAAFGLLAYQSTWLRVHRGPEFLCALLNEQPMGFYPPDALVHEAQRRGVELRPVDANASEVECSVETDLGVRIGLGYIKGLSSQDAEAIVAERRREGPYADLGQLASRAGVRAESLELLAWAGACESLDEKRGRRPDLWRLGIARGIGPRGQLALPLDLPDAPALPKLGDWQRTVADYASTQMTLGPHPLALMRKELESHVTSAELQELPDRTDLRIGGLVVARQRPETANGVVFMLIEDEFGVVNVIVPPPVYRACRLAVRTAPFVRIEGRLERRERVINVLAHMIETLATPGAERAAVRPLRSAADERGDRGKGAATNVKAGELAAVAPRVQSFGRRG
ncbi:MAG: error-prone DNA polymerase [Actinomycetota bacterium]|nr:error-prone DNA polymerase [Actinomycetota bacterium]